MPLQRVPINNFRGGLNTRDSPFELQPNESPDLSNVTLSALVGQLQVRGGKIRIGAAAMPSNVDYCVQCVVNGVAWLMCSMSGVVYNVDQNGNINNLVNGTNGTVWSFAVMPDAAGVDHVWMMNGTDVPQKWTGTGVTAAWAGSPPNGKVLKVWKNKMCITGVSANPNIVYFSPGSLTVPIDPENTTGNGYGSLILSSQDDEAEGVTELNIFKDWLFVFKARSVYYVTDPGTLSNKRIGGPGCFGRFQSAVCETEDKLYFFNEQGIWSTQGAAVAYEAGSINNWFPANLNMNALARVRMICTQDSYPRILLAMPTGTNARNSMLMECLPLMNFRRIGGRRYLLLPAFMPHTYQMDSIANFEINGTWQVVGGDSTNVRLYNLFNGSTDDGVQINAYWKSSWMAIQGEEPFERLRRLNIELSGSATIEVYGDFRKNPDFRKDVPATPAGWDPGAINSLWDDGQVWDDGNPWNDQAYRFARLRPESRARFHQINIISGLIPYKVNVVELAIRGGKEH